MIDYQTLSIVLTGIGMIIALTYYAFQIRNQNTTRQAQLFMQIYDEFREREFQLAWTEIRFWEWEDYDEFERKYGPQTNPEKYSKMLSVGFFFEGVGMLVKRRLIDMSFVDEMFSNHIITFWEKLETVISEARERQLKHVSTPRPRTWDMVEFLYDEVIKYEEQLKLKT